MAERAQITIKGIVQGVGFRPYVFNLAKGLRLKGYVSNTAGGVFIDIEGEDVAEFVRRLPKEAPPLSRIEHIGISALPEFGYQDFSIVESRDGGGLEPFTLISPDVSICEECLRELFDSADRRYLYPFINCTNCGPRYTITKAVPYDRPNTTMAAFEMCNECSGEYYDPGDRRFHAQPNACPKCGPQPELIINNSKFIIQDGENPIEAAALMLKEGAIVAVKGLGGFHIACDAENEEAVRRLRERKRKSNKPFALMAPDVAAIENFCEVSAEEREHLLSYSRPIVLLKKKPNVSKPISEVLSSHNRYLGFMLPYTPLHYLLFYFARFNALVMTSGNLSEEPIARANDEAKEKLSGIVDAFLLHNRDIFMRADDSVIRVSGIISHAGDSPDSTTSLRSVRKSGTVPVRRRCEERQEDGMSGSSNSPHRRLPASNLLFIRRSRGYAPEPISLRLKGPEVLGCGADIKNTFTLTKGDFAIPSQHIGDMENYETLRFFEESLENLKGVYRAAPVAVAHDLHPGYLSSQWALRQDLPRYPFQHHYAHVGSVMAEHGLTERVIGVAFDGTGYGSDGNLWGGEFLVAGLKGFKRAGHFRYIPLPGGEAAIREPWRTAISVVCCAAGSEFKGYLESIGFHGKYGKEKIEAVMKVMNAPGFSPLSSGAGRLFDAVAAIIGICDRNTFEGEAAIALESLIALETEEDYPVDISSDDPMIIDFSHSIFGIVDDLRNGVEAALISAKFHNTVSNVILKTTVRIGDSHGINDVVLTGGTFQNIYLLERTMKILIREGMNVFINGKVPCNDAGISLGQAFLCREKLKSES